MSLSSSQAMLVGLTGECYCCVSFMWAELQFLATVCFCYSNLPWKVKLPSIVKPLRVRPILTSAAHSKFVFIEFSPELMNVIKLYKNINVGQTEYKLKGMVRSCNKHFTCAVLSQEKWTYIDDLCSDVKEFSNLAAPKKKFKEGWFSQYMN